MESDIIVEGFQRSIELYGIRFLRLVGDGDSSVYNKLIQLKPYGNIVVTKIECRNHLLRNFSSKLRELTSRKRSNSKNQAVLPVLGKEVFNNAHRLRIAISKATHHRISENISHTEKMQLLIDDILNAPSHIFGEHKNCDAIAYFPCKKSDGQKNFVPEMKECGLYQDIEACLHRLLLHVNSLLLNMDNNLEEHYNSLVCKFVGGKRINYSLKGSYQTRCEAAAILYNTSADYYQIIFDAFQKHMGNSYTKKYIAKLQRNKEMRKEQKRRYRKKRTMALPDKDYGPEANKSLLTPEEYATEEKKFLQQLQKNEKEIKEIERTTRGQSKNPSWIQERAIRITGSNFGHICKLRPTTSCVNTIKALLYTNFQGNKATRYGLEHEPFAIQQFEEIYKLKVHACGLFIYKQHGFLAASPDGLVGDDCIIEVKCPEVLTNLSPEDGIINKKITFATLNGKNLHLKRNHNFYYQIQGQLAITNRKMCYFCLWSPLGLLVEVIQWDEKFWQDVMMPKLITFFNKCMLPELVDPFFKRLTNSES